MLIGPTEVGTVNNFHQRGCKRAFSILAAGYLYYLQMEMISQFSFAFCPPCMKEEPLLETTWIWKPTSPLTRCGSLGKFTLGSVSSFVTWDEKKKNDAKLSDLNSVDTIYIYT